MSRRRGGIIIMMTATPQRKPIPTRESPSASPETTQVKRNAAARKPKGRGSVFGAIAARRELGTLGALGGSEGPGSEVLVPFRARG